MLEHSAQVEEPLLQLLIRTDNKLAKHFWPIMVQNREEYIIWKW
jgi:hypothetical protein